MTTIPIKRTALILAYIPSRIVVKLTGEEINELVQSLNPIIKPTDILEKAGIIKPGNAYDQTNTTTERRDTGEYSLPVHKLFGGRIRSITANNPIRIATRKATGE